MLSIFRRWYRFGRRGELGRLIAGIHKALARRVVIMGTTVGFKKEIVFTGDVAKNVGIKKALEEKIKQKILVPQEPQIMGALGATLLAKAEVAKLRQTSYIEILP